MYLDFQVGPTILFECPAQIPRSSLRSFSLWARHSAETSAELNVRSGVAGGRVRGRGSGGGKKMSGRRETGVGTRYYVRSAAWGEPLSGGVCSSVGVRR